MATHTTSNRLVKQATNENFNSWGEVLNEGALDMIDEAMDGIAPLALTGNVTLSTANAATDQARKRVLNITSSTGGYVITIPAVEKVYLVRNASAYVITLTVSGGSSVEVLGGQSAWVFTNGTNIYRGTVSGWGLYTTTSEGSGTTADCTLTGLNQQFTDCLIVLDGISIGAGVNLNITVRNTSGTGGTALSLGTNSGSNKFYGTVSIPNYGAAIGECISKLYNGSSLTAPNQQYTTIGSGTGININWALASGLGSVRFAPASGNFNNSGNFKVYLR